MSFIEWFNISATPAINFVAAGGATLAMITMAFLSAMLAFQERANPFAHEKLRDTPVVWAFVALTAFCLQGPAKFAYYYWSITIGLEWSTEVRQSFLRSAFPYAFLYFFILGGAISLQQFLDYRRIRRIICAEREGTDNPC